MKPPTAQLLDADRNPVVGEELTWTWREILSSSTYGEPHVYGTATTDATGAAVVSDEPPVLDRPVLWNVKSAATDAHIAGSAVAKQRPLSGVALQPRASIYHDGVSPKYYGRWTVKGFGVTQNSVGEGDECPRVPRVGAVVDVSYQLDGTTTWTPLGSTTVDAAGRWEMLFLPEQAGEYTVRSQILAYSDRSVYLTNWTYPKIVPGSAWLEPTRPADWSLNFTGAGHRKTLSYTLSVGSILYGPWRPVSLRRSADLWFIDKYTHRRTLVRSFHDVPVREGKAVFEHRMPMVRSGTFYVRYAGLPIEESAEVFHEVTVNPTLRGWPKHGRRTTLRKSTPRTRTLTVGSLQTSKQRVLLLWKRAGGLWVDHGAVKVLKPNRAGKVTIRMPAGWRGTRHYKVFVGDVDKAGRDVYPAGGTVSGTWTITRK